MIALLVSLALLPQTALLEDAPEHELQYAFNGFVSQGYILTTDNNFLAESESGSAEFTEAVLALRLEPSESLSLGAQFFMRDLGPQGTYNVKFDWFHLDWHRFDVFALRFGRVRMPWGLYNDSSDYDPVRTSILLPQSVYPATSREFLLSVTGGEAYGAIPLGAAGLLEYSAYGGTIFFEAGTFGPDTTFEVPYAGGGRLMWETPYSGLRLGGSVMALEIDFDAVAGTPVNVDLPAVLWVTSLELVRGDFTLALEYGRWHTKVRSSDQGIVPDSDTTSERFYASLVYDMRDWLHWNVYYAGQFNDVSQRSGRENYQHDIALALRLDITDFWLVKLEAHLMKGTGYLNPALNGNTPLSQLEELWGAFIAKTTAYF